MAGGGVPNEFRVALVGDGQGEPKVMLAFGHMQWVFDPELAEDLGSVLVDAAKQAASMPAGVPNVVPANGAAPPGIAEQLAREVP
jgi:hypothetical protein